METADGAVDPTAEAFSGHHRCCCFYVPYSSSSVAAGGDGRWWSRAVMKLREWSELVAGPRWKTFIRRFSRNHPYRHFHSTKFQYDPLSYALNFDDGHGESPESEHAVHRDFPARFAVMPPVLPEKPSAVVGPSAADDGR